MIIKNNRKLCKNNSLLDIFKDYIKVKNLSRHHILKCQFFLFQCNQNLHYLSSTIK